MVLLFHESGRPGKHGRGGGVLLIGKKLDKGSGFSATGGGGKKRLTTLVFLCQGGGERGKGLSCWVPFFAHALFLNAEKSNI